MKKYAQIIFALISVFIILSLIIYPIITPILGTIILLFSLAIGIYTIFQKHKESDNPRLKIGKDTFVLVFTIMLISFLGGIAGLFANFYISNLFGAMAGFVCALLSGIVVGYLVRKGIGKVEIKF